MWVTTGHLCGRVLLPLRSKSRADQASLFKLKGQDMIDGWMNTVNYSKLILCLFWICLFGMGQSKFSEARLRRRTPKWRISCHCHCCKHAIVMINVTEVSAATATEPRSSVHSTLMDIKRIVCTNRTRFHTALNKHMSTVKPIRWMVLELCAVTLWLV